MHELGYTRDIINTVVTAGENAGAHEVRAVYLTIGEVRDIVDELFRSCFAHFAKDTIAANARIDITRVPFMVRCDECGEDYHIDLYDRNATVCPHCGSGSYHLQSGMEFRIDRLEVA